MDDVMQGEGDPRALLGKARDLGKLNAAALLAGMVVAT